MDILHTKRNGDREITPQSLWLPIAKLLLCIHESMIVNNSYSLFVIQAMFYFLAFNSGNASFRCLCALIQARYMAVDLLTLGAV